MTRKTLSEAMKEYMRNCVPDVEAYLSRNHNDLADMPRLVGSIRLFGMYKDRKISERELKKDPLWNSDLALKLIEEGIVHPGRKDISYVIKKGKDLGLYTPQEVEMAIDKYNCEFVLTD